MPYLQITKREGDHKVITSPELTVPEAEDQVSYVRENLVSHHTRQVDEEGGETRTTHKPEASGTPGEVLDLGWIEIMNDVIDDVKIVNEPASEGS